MFIIKEMKIARNEMLERVFRRAYARQGMKYEPLIDDCYEYDER